ncbi:MAG: tetratricopeptide repeat protein [Woeseiaceae bacterium]|nr:tetratricopeptide repeat protein [Woeseiaceae bacterium]NNL64228.1 tetratricopeptide repeat protein [Woeseiaceae bacterium]
MSFFGELKRRNVLRVAAAYIVAAWLLIQVAETIFPLFGFDDTPARIVVITLMVLFVPAVIIAWVFELTPEGLKRDHEVDRSQSIAPQTGKKLDRIIMVVLAVAVGYFAFDKFVLSESRETSIAEAARQEGRSEALVALYGDTSIAVLPFVNLSSDQEQAYFADGLSEELLNLLAKIPALRVIARTSSFSYRGQDIDVANVSRELEVDNLLSGSVRKAGNKVRITTKLIRAEDNSHIWAETYERTLDDIFLIQDEIAAAVVTQLKVKLLGEVPTSEKTDPRAYALYLEAREQARQYKTTGFERSIDLYQEALDIAPDYAAAWAGLAESYIWLTNRALLDIDEGYVQARNAANKALALDPDHALAYANLGRIAMLRDGDLQSAAQNLERALELDSTNPQIIRAAATLLTNLVRLEEAIGLLEYAAARDPVNSDVHANLALGYYYAGRAEEAIASYRTALSLSPGAFGLRSFIGAAFLFNGEPAAALAEIQQELNEAWRLVGEAMAYHGLGRAAESDAKLTELIEKYDPEWTYNIAYVLAYRGETDQAFERLNNAMKRNDPGLSEIAPAPEFANIETDPRWLPFLESIGKAPGQLAAVEFKVTLPE